MPTIRLQTLFSTLLLLAAGTTAHADETPAMLKYSIDELAEENAKTDLPYLNFMRVESMSTYLYELPAGATDMQNPHDQDEIYYVVAGRATAIVEGEITAIAPGDILFVKKNAVHKFVDITEDLQLLVVFAPPDSD